MIGRSVFATLVFSLAVGFAADAEALGQPEHVGCSLPNWIKNERVIMTRDDAIVVARIYASSLLGDTQVKDAEPLSASGSLVVRMDARSGCALSVFRMK